jgi:hypothetical protein
VPAPFSLEAYLVTQGIEHDISLALTSISIVRIWLRLMSQHAAKFSALNGCDPATA